MGHCLFFLVLEFFSSVFDFRPCLCFPLTKSISSEAALVFPAGAQLALWH